jgi:hypothetical protein
LALCAGIAQGNQTHYYYNETGKPVKVLITYSNQVGTKQTQRLKKCIQTEINLKAPTEQQPEPWAMRKPLTECAISTIEAFVGDKQTPAQPLEYKLGFQGQGEFSIREMPEGSGNYAVVEYKE